MKRIIYILILLACATVARGQRIYTLNYDTVKVINGAFKVTKQPAHVSGTQRITVIDSLTGEYKWIRSTQIGTVTPVNGLQAIGGGIGWGGGLTQPSTLINLSGNNYFFLGDTANNSTYLGIQADPSAGIINFQSTGQTTVASSNSGTGEQTVLGMQPTEVALNYNNSSGSKGFTFDATRMLIFDDLSLTGLKYKADYSANFTSRSIPDVAYVLAHGGTGTVTTVSGVNTNGFTWSIANPTTTPALTLTLQNATTSQSGQLTSTDWNTFNGKQAALGFTPENVANKTATASTSTTTYPNWLGVENYVTGLNYVTASSVTTFTNKDLTSGTNTFPTFNQNTTGSAAKWATARLLAGNSVDGSANVPFANKFIVQGTTDAGLTGSQFLGALGTGIVKNTTATGVLSIAAAGTDYQAPITLTTTGSGAATFISNVLNIPVDAGGTVTSVSGTANRITSTGGTTPVIDISASYVGQSSITTVGTLSSGAVPTTLLTGTLQSGQFPALTGDITTTAGSLATVLKNTGTAGTYGQVTTDAQGRVSAGQTVTDIAHGGTGSATQNFVDLTTNQTAAGVKTFNSTVTASSAIALGHVITGTLTAAANNDNLIAVDINPTYTNGAFTGVENAAIRSGGDIIPRAASTWSLGTTSLPWQLTVSRNVQTTFLKSSAGTDFSITTSDNTNNIKFQLNSTGLLGFTVFHGTGNSVFGTSATDNGYKGDFQTPGTAGYFHAGNFLVDANGNPNAPYIIADITGINAKTIATTNLFTVPTGRVLTVTAVYLRCTTATGATVGATADVGDSVNGAASVYASTSTGLFVVNKIFQYPAGGVNFSVPAAGVLQLNINTGGTATTLTYEATVVGILK